MYVVGAYADVADECAIEPQGAPVLNGSGGALIYDVAADPHDPPLVGCMNADGYSHDIHCVVYSGPDADYQGREICIGSNEDTVTIYDATDPADVTVVDRLTYYAEGLEVGDIYTHQGWWSEDQTYFFLGDELDELSGAVSERTTFIWDVSDLDDARVVGSHGDGNTSIDHNMFVLDGLLYQLPTTRPACGSTTRGRPTRAASPCGGSSTSTPPTTPPPSPGPGATTRSSATARWS